MTFPTPGVFASLSVCRLPVCYFEADIIHLLTAERNKAA